ncbi:MAG: hypothetical protein SFV18_07790 [Bryobacteraceae bacterium]|nr:hypothetical protein [Bryobacteraceae bacterium]
MNDDYLWDRSGPPDIEVARLEKLLAPLGAKPRSRSRRWIAGAVAVAVAALAFVFAPPPATEWKHEGRHLRAGDVVVEGTISSASTGSLELEPSSRLRLTGARRFSLDQGTMHALIWAPPTEFVVDTPAAKAVDLGCRYTLRVEPGGRGELSVQTGWVAFEAEGRESFIPAGASCETAPGRAPGIPCFDDAAPEFRLALREFEAGRSESLDRALSAARPRDALSLWHLLSRTEGEARARVYDRLAADRPMPDRAAVLRGGREALDASWNALGLGGAEWWRLWRRKW